MDLGFNDIFIHIILMSEDICNNVGFFGVKGNLARNNRNSVFAEEISCLIFMKFNMSFGKEFGEISRFEEYTLRNRIHKHFFLILDISLTISTFNF